MKDDVIQITVINAGHMNHNFGIAKIPIKTENLIRHIFQIALDSRIGNLSYDQVAAMPCQECQPVFQQAHIETFMQPLSQQVITFTASKEGEFKYFCMVRGHLWLGMMGTLIVEDAKKGNTV
jgi:plastocyanin